MWIDHLRRGNAALVSRLEEGWVQCHPFVIGELACGNLRNGQEILSLLAALPRTPLAEHEEVLGFVEDHGLLGRGTGWIDAHLLASAKLANVTLWTRDRRLEALVRAHLR